jgi:hypothetical protein
MQATSFLSHNYRVVALVVLGYRDRAMPDFRAKKAKEGWEIIHLWAFPPDKKVYAELRKKERQDHAPEIQN